MQRNRLIAEEILLISPPEKTFFKIFLKKSQNTPCIFLKDVVVYICCPMKQHADIAQ